MVWNYDECYIKYQQVSKYLCDMLGISQLDCDLNHACYLPYQTQIIDYLNTRLITLGTDDIKARIQEVFDVFDWGADLICSQAALELAREVGVGSEDPEYDQEKFVFAWADLMSTLGLRLRLQYSYLFAENAEECENCCCCGGKGQGIEDYESWQSGVYPNDEVYDRANYDRVHTSWKVSRNRYCECYRHNSQSSNSSEGSGNE